MGFSLFHLSVGHWPEDPQGLFLLDYLFRALSRVNTIEYVAVRQLSLAFNNSQDNSEKSHKPQVRALTSGPGH